MDWKQERPYRWVTPEGYEVLEETPFSQTLEEAMGKQTVWSWRGPGMLARDFVSCCCLSEAQRQAEAHNSQTPVDSVRALV